MGRGFLADAIHDPSELSVGDLRKSMPRFCEPQFSFNLKLLDQFRAIAVEVGCTPAQLSIAWLLHRDERLVPIPGTVSIEHMEENRAAPRVRLSPDALDRLDALINQQTVQGHRYAAWARQTIDTEEFA